MEKKGDPGYMRLPLPIEAEVRRLAEQEGRKRNDMIIYLIAIGIHFFQFKISDYVSFSHED